MSLALLIANCGECPLCVYDNTWGRECVGAGALVGAKADIDNLARWVVDGPPKTPSAHPPGHWEWKPPPDDCPLRKTSVTLSLETP